MEATGRVYLLGAGPGDPELLTLKALRILQSARVVVHDRLVSPEILALIPNAATCIDVGKASGHHTLPQEQINALLVQWAQRGNDVIRLKGGDPYIFGRGSEEALYLREHHIEFEVIPGVTAAGACAAAAGVPLTHRGMARRVHMLTGHFRDDQAIDIDWPRLVDRESTLVIYMGLSNLELICRELIAAGMSETMPAMVVQDGTTDKQRQVTAPLTVLPQRVAEAGLGTPALIIIGPTVALAEQLARPVSAAKLHLIEDRIDARQRLVVAR